MKRTTLLMALLPVAALAGPPEHFTLSAAFVPPAKPGTNGSIAVSFIPKDPDIRVNEEPAPSFKLDPAQAVLVDKREQTKSASASFDPATARYLDPKVPVRFPMALSPQAPKGMHNVKGTLTYFYCSKRDGWCRKGANEIEVAVQVP